jgi:hypothetical protein
MQRLSRLLIVLAAGIVIAYPFAEAALIAWTVEKIESLHPKL